VDASQSPGGMTAVTGGGRAGLRLSPAALAWSVAAVSTVGFVAAWVLAAVNGDLLKISAAFGPDRFLVAYPVVGAVLASRRRSIPVGWILLGMGLVAGGRALAARRTWRSG